jgi:hypothetical protein
MIRIPPDCVAGQAKRRSKLPSYPFWLLFRQPSQQSGRLQRDLGVSRIRILFGIGRWIRSRISIWIWVNVCRRWRGWSVVTPPWAVPTVCRPGIGRPTPERGPAESEAKTEAKSKTEAKTETACRAVYENRSHHMKERCPCCCPHDRWRRSAIGHRQPPCVRSPCGRLKRDCWNLGQRAHC